MCAAWLLLVILPCMSLSAADDSGAMRVISAGLAKLQLTEASKDLRLERCQCVGEHKLYYFLTDRRRHIASIGTEGKNHYSYLCDSYALDHHAGPAGECTKEPCQSLRARVKLESSCISH